MRKRIRKKWAGILILALTAGMVSIPVSGPGEVKAAVVFDKEFPDDTSYIGDGNYRLTKDVTKPIVIREEAVVNIDLAGFKVNGGTIGSAILIEDDAKLGLYDSKGGGVVTGKTGTRRSGIVGGAGVYVSDDAVFEMYGGNIIDCEVEGTTTDIAGAGVFVKDDATFTMYGGRISKNTLRPIAGRNGMGAGMYSLGTVTLKGGVIDGNGNGATLGGGIYTTRALRLDGSATITGNSAAMGGGIFVRLTDDSAVCDLSGGEIKSNSSLNGGGGVYVSAGSLRLSGTIDVSAQLPENDDICFEKNDPSDMTRIASRFCHKMPTRSGYTFSLHEKSATGVDVTDLYRGDAWKNMNMTEDTSLYVIWVANPVTPDPTVAPTTVPTLAPTTIPSLVPSAAPTASVEPTATVTPTVTPEPSYGPGEGKDSAEYAALSDKDKKLADDLVKKDGTISYPTAADMVTYARANGITEKELLLTDKVIRSYKANSSLKGSTKKELCAEITKVGKKALTLKWKKQGMADGYRIYGNIKKKSKALRKMESVTQGTLKKKISSLKKGTKYKFVVQAYRLIDGAPMTVTVSAMVFGKTKG